MTPAKVASSSRASAFVWMTQGITAGASPSSGWQANSRRMPLVVEADAKQSAELRNQPDIVDSVRFQPRLDLAETLRRHDKGRTPDQGPAEGGRLEPLPQGDALLLAVGKGW
jgi:hypothetical protein